MSDIDCQELFIVVYVVSCSIFFFQQSVRCQKLLRIFVCRKQDPYAILSICN